MMKVMALLVFVLALPVSGSAEEICFREMQCCIAAPDEDEFRVEHAALDAPYDEVILKGGLLLRADSKKNGTFMSLSVVKANMTDLFRQDFYDGYVYGSIRSKENLGRYVGNQDVRTADDSTVTLFEEMGVVNQSSYGALHKILLKGNYIYSLSAGKLRKESFDPRNEPDLVTFIQSITFGGP